MWWMKILEENAENIKIAWSVDDNSLDGIVNYNKSSKIFSLERYSKTSDGEEYTYKKMLMWICKGMKEGKLTYLPYCYITH